jgi:hypothetical protein
MVSFQECVQENIRCCSESYKIRKFHEIGRKSLFLENETKKDQRNTSYASILRLYIYIIPNHRNIPTRFSLQTEHSRGGRREEKTTQGCGWQFRVACLRFREGLGRRLWGGRSRRAHRGRCLYRAYWGSYFGRIRFRRLPLQSAEFCRRFESGVGAAQICLRIPK